MLTPREGPGQKGSGGPGRSQLHRATTCPVSQATLGSSSLLHPPWPGSPGDEVTADGAAVPAPREGDAWQDHAQRGEVNTELSATLIKCTTAAMQASFPRGWHGQGPGCAVLWFTNVPAARISPRDSAAPPKPPY